MRKTSIPSFKLINAAMNAIRLVHTSINKSLKGDGRSMAENFRTKFDIRTNKEALLIDEFAEASFKELFEKEFGSDVVVYGEESLSITFAHKTMQDDKIYALVDIIDGTDLLEMQIPLWCSAIVFFDAKIPKIIGAVIGLATGEMYYTYDDKDVYVFRDHSPRQESVYGPSNVTSLKDARICFYGQKAKNILSLIGTPGSADKHAHADFQEKLTSFIETEKYEGRKLNFRLYNFAGNPIMVRLIDRFRDEGNNLVGRGFDAVFDIAGQSLHDVIPGVFIAKQANAYLCDLDGKEISNEELAKRLLNPADRMTYILASTKELANELREMLPKTHSVIP